MKRKLLIDTGHSAKYQGASGIRTEVDWVRMIAERLVPKIDTTYWDVIRVPDSYHGETISSTLIKRIAWINANSSTSDFLLSIHANSSENPAARGVETYYYTGMKEPEQEAIKLSKAYNLATGVPIRGGDGAKGDTESQHPRLGIIRDTKPLALLIETGFVGNKDDMSVDPDVAAQGIANYLNSLKPMDNTQKPAPTEMELALQELNKKAVIKDISNPGRTVTLGEVALMIARNNRNNNLTK